MACGVLRFRGELNEAAWTPFGLLLRLGAPLGMLLLLSAALVGLRDCYVASFWAVVGIEEVLA